MSLRLTDPKTLPKDGFIYIQPETGRKLGGMFSFSYVVQEIVGYRQGNNLPRANKLDASDDLDTFTCNHYPQICFDSSIRVSEQARQVSACGSCGIQLT